MEFDPASAEVAGWFQHSFTQVPSGSFARSPPQRVENGRLSSKQDTPVASPAKGSGKYPASISHAQVFLQSHWLLTLFLWLDSLLCLKLCSMKCSRTKSPVHSYLHTLFLGNIIPSLNIKHLIILRIYKIHLHH